MIPLKARRMGPWAKFQNSYAGVTVHVLMSPLAYTADPDRKVMEILENPLKCHHCL